MHTRRAQFAANYPRHRAALVALAKAHRYGKPRRCNARACGGGDRQGRGHCRISNHGRSRRGLLSRGRCRVDGRTQRGKGWLLPLRQRGRRGAGAGRRARYSVFRLRAGKPADGAFELARRIEGYGLPAALRTVTLHPARAAGLNDRGQIAAGLRADLARVRMVGDLPVVREVYRGGRRVI
jgi:hypothetical protein